LRQRRLTHGGLFKAANNQLGSLCYLAGAITDFAALQKLTASEPLSRKNSGFILEKWVNMA
jgi:hypothetical protein